MNREDLDACTNRPTCTASWHVMACPSDQRRPPEPDSPRVELDTNLCPWGCSILPPHRHTGFPGDTNDRVTYAGVWLAYYPDRSGMAIFAGEVEALRYAVEHSMQATFWPFGTDWNEATR